MLTPDPHTAEIVLSRPAPYLLAALTASETPIVPKHRYDGDVLGSPNGKAPIGTGPFVFKEWVQGSHILYERNPDYWDPGKPYLDRIVVRFIADANARAVALETGEVLYGPDTRCRSPSSMRSKPTRRCGSRPAATTTSRSSTGSSSTWRTRTSSTSRCARRWPTR